MKQEEYRTCMAQGLKGKKGLSKEERQQLFCVQSRLCSGKATNEQEAARLCAEAAANPKTPKAKKARRGKIDTGTLAACVIKGLEGAGPTLANLPPILANCTGQKVDKSGREAFIKRCFKENTTGNGFQYDIKEAQKLRSFCISEWKKQEAAT